MLEKFNSKRVSKEQLETVQGGWTLALYAWATGTAYGVGYAINYHIENYNNDDY